MTDGSSESKGQSPESSQSGEDNGRALGPDEQYCTSCGAVIKSEAAICPECGVSQADGGTGSAQSNTAQSADKGGRSRDEFEQRISDLEVEGWEVKSRTNDKAVMVDRKMGSLGAHTVLIILTGWWTFGIGNAVYLGYKYFIDVDKQVIRR